MPTSLMDIAVGDPCIVTAQLSHARAPMRGEVVRVATAYFWVRTTSIRDNLRVARVSGKGSLHSVSYVVTLADPETLLRIDRADALDRFRGALFIMDNALRGRGEQDFLARASVEELNILDRRLRDLAAFVKA